MRFSARNSVEATRAALGYLQAQGPANYLPLHLALFSLRGIVNGKRAIAEAARLGGDRKLMIDAADSERTTQWMKDAFKLGNSLGMVATPSYLVASEAYVGIMSWRRSATRSRALADSPALLPEREETRRALWTTCLRRA